MMNERLISGEERRAMNKHKENGFDVVCTHSGQKMAYGDIFREFTIKSSKSQDEVQAYCNEHVYRCHLPYDEWLSDFRKDCKTDGRDFNQRMADHFRNCFKFRKVNEGEYFYQVIQQSTH